MYQITQYFKFLLKSTNEHGVHSPFVFDLITKCFYDKKKYPDYNALLNYTSTLLKNTESIEVTDLGAGSQLMKQQNRSIASMAKNAGSTNKRAKLLYRLTAYFKPENILELGTSLGIATTAMHLGHRQAKITTIEGCPNIANFTKQNFEQLGYKNISVITGDFNTEIKKLKLQTYDLIFFDGNHQKEATLQYFELLLDTAHNDSVFIFDDIYWSPGMTEAWNTIKKHPKVTVTIDTFFWGFVFFRKEQVREDFVIRL
ncbi:O-methyltransferase [Algibacter miyuki]|uniref:O-methyltransferase n=1 Tax=Algibacter miyuki TaxID=1306933 RepID=A0ABV5H1R2_9FLAO|nr:class I SAM-dependent methyltransferase [Algibacter miyuki]MDN3666444.1 class I SAM-dependent methyltransferase [Algibacter miyuki]